MKGERSSPMRQERAGAKDVKHLRAMRVLRAILISVPCFSLIPKVSPDTERVLRQDPECTQDRTKMCPIVYLELYRNFRQRHFREPKLALPVSTSHVTSPGFFSCRLFGFFFFSFENDSQRATNKGILINDGSFIKRNKRNLGINRFYQFYFPFFSYG